jgi:macrolide transport system ATP-binding/permease protein
MIGASRFALWLHERTLRRDEREAVIGDLVEELEWRSARDPRGAAWWIWAQTCRSCIPNLRRRVSTDRMPLADEPARRDPVLHGLATDLRFSVRLLLRQPLATLVGFVSLAAGLGLNILLLTLADAALFRPLPLRDPGRLMVVLLQRESGLMRNFSYPEYQDLRDNARTVDGLVAYGPVEASVSASSGASSMSGEVVSGNFFSTLGVPIVAGRGLGDADDRAGAPPAAVVSEQLWRDVLGGAGLGQAISLNGQAYTVVGVAARHFPGMQVGRKAAFWVPIAHSRAVAGGDYLGRRTVSWLTLVGRVRSDVGEEATRQELDAILRRVRESTGRPIEPVVLRPGARGDSQLTRELQPSLLLLLAAGALVLLVACFNVANLQIARTEARRVEMAVRSALGARRVQLLRLILLDGLIVSAAAGAAGIALAAASKDRAASLIALYGQPVALAIPVDLRIVTAAAALSLIAGLVIGLLSMGQILRRRVAVADGRAETVSRRPAQRALVVVQIALSMALLTGAALLVRTLDRLRHTDLGFDARQIALVELSPEMARMPGPRAVAYFDEAVRAVAALPGVQAAGVAHVMPLDFGGSRASVDVAGYKPAADEDMELNFARVSPGYFAAMGIPIRQGRAFDERDTAGQPERIIVNETMARRFWPGGQAVGRLVRFNDRDPYAVEVIGVAADVHYRMVREEPRASFYAPLTQWPATSGVVHVRVAGDPGARIEEFRRAAASVNPSVPVVRAYTLIDQVERNLADERMARAIGVTLAIVALLLSAAGLYATMAFLVGRRTREIGVRMALGARTADVRTLVLREGLTLALAGVAIGIVLSGWAGHMLRNRLYEIGGMDITSVVAAAAILSTAALVASWLPARRASKVDPVVALREP